MSVRVGVRDVLLHALRESVRDFFASLGFRPSPADDLTLMATLEQRREMMRGGKS